MPSKLFAAEQVICGTSPFSKVRLGYNSAANSLNLLILGSSRGFIELLNIVKEPEVQLEGNICKVGPSVRADFASQELAASFASCLRSGAHGCNIASGLGPECRCRLPSCSQCCCRTLHVIAQTRSGSKLATLKLKSGDTVLSLKRSVANAFGTNSSEALHEMQLVFREQVLVDGSQTLMEAGLDILAMVYVEEVALLKVLTAFEDGTVKSFDVQSGTCEQSYAVRTDCARHNLGTADGGLHAVGTTGCGKFVVSYDDGVVKVFDMKKLCTLTLSLDLEFPAILSPSGQHVLAVVAGIGDQSSVKIFDSSSGTCEQNLAVYGSTVVTAAFSPDGTKVLTACSDFMLKMFSAKSGTCEHQARSGGRIVSAVFSADGLKFITCGFHGQIKTFDSASFTCERTWELKDILKSADAIIGRYAEFSPDRSKVLVVHDSPDTNISICDTETLACKWTHKDDLENLGATFAHDGCKVLVSSMGRARILNADTGLVEWTRDCTGLISAVCIHTQAPQQAMPAKEAELVESDAKKPKLA